MPYMTDHTLKIDHRGRVRIEQVGYVDQAFSEQELRGELKHALGARKQVLERALKFLRAHERANYEQQLVG